MRVRDTFALAVARVMSRRNQGRIEDAGADTRRVEVEYIKKSGERTVREIRPYEIKPHRTSGTVMVYATDDRSGGGQIKSFIANRVLKVGDPTGKFRPRWPVMFGEEDEEDSEE
jgi:predicted DNA-binding transcriptional regulator YafY